MNSGSFDAYQWLALVSPITVVLASYLFGLATKRYDRKIQASRERYENLYIPFIQWLARAPLDWLSPWHYSPKLRSSLMNLLLENVQYLGKESSRVLLPLYDAHLNLDKLDVDKDSRYLLTAPKDYTEQFDLMAVTLLKEATQLSKELRLPDLAGTIAKSLGDQVIIPAKRKDQ